MGRGVVGTVAGSRSVSAHVPIPIKRRKYISVLFL